MNRAELLQIIRESFDIYKNNNRALPKYKGLPDMLDAMVQLLDGHTGNAGADIEDLRQQLQALKNQVDAIDPGLNDQQVQAKIDAAINALNDTISDIQDKNNQQDTQIQGLRQDVNNLPGPAVFTDLSAKVSELTTRMDANVQKDSQQDTSISQLELALQHKPSNAALQALNQALQSLEADFIAHQQVDVEQSADIAQLKQDILDIPSSAAFDEIKNQLTVVQNDLTANKAHDDTQDGEIDALQQAIQGIPTSTALEELKAAVSILEENLNKNTTHDGEQDTAISTLEQAIQNIPTTTVIEELKAALAALETSLNDNATHDGEQDTAITALQQIIDQLPAGVTLGDIHQAIAALESSLTANTTHDGEQDTAISALQEAIAQIPTSTALDEIRQSIADLTNKLVENTTHDGEQDTAITALQQALEQIPDGTALDEVRELITELGNNLADNITHDGEQDAAIENINQRLDNLPGSTDIDALQAAVDNLESALQNNNERDDVQDGKIAQIEEDIVNIPTNAAFTLLQQTVNDLRRDLSTNITRDDGQDEQINEIKEDLRNLPTDAAIRQINEAIDALETGLSINNRNDANQDHLLRKLQNELAPKAELEELGNILSNNESRDDDQDTAIGELQQQLANIATDGDLEQLRAELNANAERDDQQDSAIEQLQTGLTDNATTDTRQDEDIEELREQIANIPTEAGLQVLRDAIAELTTKLEGNEARDDAQDREIDDLTTWRKTVSTALEELTERFAGKDDILELKEELTAEIAAVQAACEEKIAPLADLPERVAALEQRLDNLPDSLDEATVRAIAQEEIIALREELEQRIQDLENQLQGTTNDLGPRLQKAEADILKLFELVGNGGPGNGQDGATQAYVQAELNKLEIALRSELKTLKDNYALLADVPTTLQQIQDELATKTTVEQVNTLITAAVANLASTADLESLRDDLQTAYENYVNTQLETYITQLNTLETTLRAEWTLQLETALTNIWEQLSEQEFPETWRDIVREIATTLDNVLKEEILAQVQSWQEDLQNTIDQGNQDLQTTILNEISNTYVSITDLEAEKENLLTTLRQEIETALAALPPILSEEQVKNLAEEEARRLDEALSTRITALEALELGTHIEQLLNFQTTIEAMDLSTFITLIQNLNLDSVVKLVDDINIWKQRAQGQFNDLTQQVEELKELVSEYTDTGVGDRLARVCLTGWGPMGGMEIYSDAEHCLHISAGQCITPDGHVVGLEQEAAYASYFLLADDHELKQNQEQNQEEDQEESFFKDIDVWQLVAANPSAEELAAAEASSNERRWLTPQNNRERDEPFISDKTVIVTPGPVFYLVRIADYLKQTGKDGEARRQVERERNFEDADYKFSASFSPADNLPSNDILYRVFHPAYNLPTIPLYRFGFRPQDDCTVAELDQTDFPNSLISLTGLYDTWKPIVEDALVAVNEQVGYLLDQYGATLFPQLPKSQFTETLEILLANWTTFKRFAERNGGQIERCYVQYFYDWARDLIRAYHECRECLQELMADLCLLTPTTLKGRNQHVSLGLAWQVRQDGLAAPLRDDFHQPPIYNSNARRWEETRVYYRRIFELIESFYLPEALPNDRLPQKFRQDEEEDPFRPDFSKIKITPGKNLGAPLGSQAIPFYYPLTEGDGSLQYYWDYAKARNRTYDQHRSYHASDGYESYNHPDDWHVTRPLYFSLDEADFYRVEGHLNRAEILPETIGVMSGDTVWKFTAVKAIHYLMHKHNLDCNAVSIKLPTNLSAGVTGITKEEILQALVGDTEETSETTETGENPGGDPTVTETEENPPQTTALAENYSFHKFLQGAEHYGGVPRGGTLILVVQENEEGQDIIIADFAVPYRLSQSEIDAI